MTQRERLTRLFNGQEIDRVPIWLLFPVHRRGGYADVHNLECYRPVIKCIDEHCVSFDRRNYTSYSFCHNGNPDIITKTMREPINGVLTDVHEINYKDLKLRRFTETTATGKLIRHFINDAYMLEKIAEIPYIKPEADFSVYFKEKESLGGRGFMMMDLGDPLGPLYNLASAEDFAVWTLTDYDKMLAFTDVMFDRVYEIYKRYLENGIGDVFFIVGTEFAEPPLVSPDKFYGLSANYMKKIVELIRSYGRFSIIHHHGSLLPILEGMNEINPDGLHTIEAPPIGDCTIAQARKGLGATILIGNVQYDDILRLPTNELIALTRETVEEGMKGRFILSPTAGPYEDYIPEQMVKNYIAFVETGIKYGKY